MRKNLFFAPALAVVTFGLVMLLAQDFLLRIAFENILTRTTGMKAKIESFHYQYPGAFHIWGLRLYNPPGFENPLFAECPRIYMILNMPEFVRRENLHVYQVEASVRKIYVEKNKEGVLNLDFVKPANSKPSLPFDLDLFRWTVQNADYLDQSAEAPRKVSLELNAEREEAGPFKSPQDVLAWMTSRLTGALPALAGAE